MPDVSRTLTNRGTQTDGLVRVLERIIDAKGRIWDRVYKAVSEAQATTDMNALDLTEPLKDADFRDLLTWVQAKNASDDFDLTDRDLTLLEGEERLLIWFAGEPGDEAITLAWWVEGMTPPVYSAIRIRAGFDAAQGSDIQDRAISLLAAEPLFDQTVEL